VNRHRLSIASNAPKRGPLRGRPNRRDCPIPVQSAAPNGANAVWWIRSSGSVSAFLSNSAEPICGRRQIRVIPANPQKPRPSHRRYYRSRSEHENAVNTDSAGGRGDYPDHRAREEWGRPLRRPHRSSPRSLLVLIERLGYITRRCPEGTRMVSSLTRNQVRRKPLRVRIPCPPLRMVSHVFAQAHNL
jgi:hypothetical protein